MVSSLGSEAADDAIEDTLELRRMTAMCSGWDERMVMRWRYDDKAEIARARECGSVVVTVKRGCGCW